MYETASLSARTYVLLRLADVVATLMISENCRVTSALTLAGELVLTSSASCSETSGVSDVNFLFFPPVDIEEAKDERDANDVTDSSSSDFARARDPLPIGEI
jgi:hypothetical protein